jgi:hypothetical protein
VKKLAVLLLLGGLNSASLAATRVTVEQVEQLLTSAHGEPDAKVAARIADLELVERASPAWLSRWQNEFPGKHTREALLGLADASAFLDLPPADVPSIEQPAPDMRKQIFLRAIGYINTTIHQLPNFSARRSTIHFDDVPVAQQMFNQYVADRMNGFESFPAPPTPTPSVAQPMHVGKSSSVIVTYRDGREVVDAPTESSPKSESQEIGFTTSGEFGPILSVVMGDVVHSRVYWGYWEQGATAPLAVFRYTVPQEMSHYMVLFRSGSKLATPAYHGEIAIDPATGTILRVMLVSEPTSSGFVETSIVVEYDPIAIGGKTYTLPIRGVALCKLPDSAGRAAVSPFTNVAGVAYTIPSQTFLNDVSFTEYHVFRAEMRILR